ncbi:MAG: hypothetical protein JWP87_4253 [Labilithrix sp.]|nr:hypothetical protein [Labilithrix sp.]
MKRFLSLLALLPLFALAACEWHVSDDRRDTSSSAASSREPARGGSSTPSSADGAAPTCDVKLDRWKELLVINRSVLLDRRAKNDVAGAPWSFRTRLEELAGSPDDAPALAAAWLDEWKTRTSVGADGAPVTPRPAVEDVLLAPWRYDASAPLAVDRAPFRLVAIANRLDLRENPLGCEGASGELRFVYTAVDAKTRLAIPFSVIVEVPYPASRTPRDWASRWHDIAKLPFGADYNEALATLTAEITSKASRSATRVRTNEVALGAKLGLPWELREFGLDPSPGGARLVEVPLATTPRIELERSPSLDAWAQDNASKVLAGTHVLPGGMQAGAAPMRTSFFQWPSNTMPEDVRHALSMATCNGCHGGERPGDLLRFQHVAPGDTTSGYYTATNGETQVSSYLNDPSGGDDELGRRAASVARMLCTDCGVQSAPPSYTP